jgi:hypothetical protein
LCSREQFGGLFERLWIVNIDNIQVALLKQSLTKRKPFEFSEGQFMNHYHFNVDWIVMHRMMLDLSRAPSRGDILGENCRNEKQI